MTITKNVQITPSAPPTADRISDAADCITKLTYDEMMQVALSLKTRLQAHNVTVAKDIIASVLSGWALTSQMATK